MSDDDIFPLTDDREQEAEEEIDNILQQGDDDTPPFLQQLTEPGLEQTLVMNHKARTMWRLSIMKLASIICCTRTDVFITILCSVQMSDSINAWRQFYRRNEFLVDLLCSPIVPTAAAGQGQTICE